MKETKLTTVKILSELYNNFKKDTIENEFTLQKLVNRSMFLYTTDNNFKDNIVFYANRKEGLLLQLPCYGVSNILIPYLMSSYNKTC